MWPFCCRKCFNGFSVFADISLQLSWIPCEFGRKEDKWSGHLSKIQLDLLREEKLLRETFLFEDKKDLIWKESEAPKLENKIY